MAGYLLDTGVLIRLLRARPEFEPLMLRLEEDGPLYISAYTRLELLTGMREHERGRTIRLIDSLRTHPLDATTADLAGNLRREWRARGVTLHGPDAAIAASALRLGVALVTLNPRDFPYPELSVLAVDESGGATPVVR